MSRHSGEVEFKFYPPVVGKFPTGAHTNKG